MDRTRRNAVEYCGGDYARSHPANPNPPTCQHILHCRTQRQLLEERNDVCTERAKSIRLKSLFELSKSFCGQKFQTTYLQRIQKALGGSITRYHTAKLLQSFNPTISVKKH